MLISFCICEALSVWFGSPLLDLLKISYQAKVR